MSSASLNLQVEELLVGICLLRIPQLAEFNALNSKLTTKEFIQQINSKQEVLDELMSEHAHLSARRFSDGLIAYFQNLEGTLQFSEAASTSALNDSSNYRHHWRHLSRYVRGLLSKI